MYINLNFFFFFFSDHEVRIILKRTMLGVGARKFAGNIIYKSSLI